MNSSGIKRGVAAAAISALAVTGLPFFASSASAAPGDEFTFVVAGPTRDNANPAEAWGGYVVLKSKEGTVSQADADGTGVPEIKAIGADLTSPASTPNQTVSVNLAGVMVVADDASNPFGGDDGWDEIYVPVRVDTSTTGATASYALYLDEDGGGTVDAAEPRAAVSQSTSGAPASISVDPSLQTAPAGSQSGNYVGTVKDAAGRTTQILMAGEDIVVNPDADTQIQKITTPASAEGALDANQTFGVADIAQRGQFTFKARSSVTTLHTIAIDGPGAVDASATLDVVTAFTAITESMVDIVTGADTWDEPGDGTDGGATQVRPDQTSIDVVIDAGVANAGKTISLVATGTGVTFGGAGSTTLTKTIDAQGKATFTVAADAASVAAGDSILIDAGDFEQTLNFTAPTLAASGVTTDGETYLSAFGGSVTVKVAVKDQYGNPITGTYVAIDREGGRNDAAPESARTAVDANGVATITLTDTATGNSVVSDNLDIAVYPGQLGTALVTINDAATIAYSADGQGAPFIVTADGTLPAGSAYDPNATFARPLTDTTVSAVEEEIQLAITGGTAGAPVTVTVDNDALVLKGTETRLAQGSSSETSTIGGDDLSIIGTKAGLVNVTVSSGGRTNTFQVSVRASAQDNLDLPASARNVSVSGPEKGTAGEVVNFVATVTDAFGNPVRGVPAGALSTVVTGGGQVIGNSGNSNSLGQITYAVQIADAADGDLTLRVTGSGYQFGAAQDRLAATDTTNTGPGLTASEATDSATIEDVVNMEELEQAVEEAQAKVDLAQDALDAAKDEKSVAVAEKQVAQKAVKAAKKDLKKAKKKHKGVAAAKKALRDARGDLKVAKAKVKAANKKVNRTKDRLADAQAELEAAEQALEDAQS